MYSFIIFFIHQSCNINVYMIMYYLSCMSICHTHIHHVYVYTHMYIIHILSYICTPHTYTPHTHTMVHTVHTLIYVPLYTKGSIEGALYEGVYIQSLLCMKSLPFELTFPSQCRADPLLSRVGEVCLRYNKTRGQRDPGEPPRSDR